MAISPCIILYPLPIKKPPSWTVFLVLELTNSPYKYDFSIITVKMFSNGIFLRRQIRFFYAFFILTISKT